MKHSMYFTAVIAMMLVIGFTACTDKNQDMEANTQLVGHWKQYYYYDGKGTKTPMDFERHLWLEADSTFRYYKNEALVDKGTWSIGHTERYYEMSPLVADKFRDSIVFAGADTTVIRFFEYPSEKNRYRLQMIFANPIEWPDWCSSPEYWERMEK